MRCTLLTTIQSFARVRGGSLATRDMVKE
jgi:hypothetical protein